MLIREVICAIYPFDTLMIHLSIEKQTLMCLFTVIIIQLDSFVDIYTICIHDFHFISNIDITIFNRLSIMFVNCIGIEFTSVDIMIINHISYILIYYIIEINNFWYD